MQITPLFSRPIEFNINKDLDELFFHLKKVLEKKQEIRGYQIARYEPQSSNTELLGITFFSDNKPVVTYFIENLLGQSKIKVYLENNNSNFVSRTKQFSAALSQIGKRQTNYDWRAVLSRGFSYASNCRLIGFTKIGGLDLRSSGKSFIINHISIPSHIGSWNAMKTVPIIIFGKDSGYTDSVALDRAVKNVSLLAMLISLVWEQLWVIASVPVLSSSFSPKLPTNNWLREGVGREKISDLKRRSLPKWLNQAFVQISIEKTKNIRLYAALCAYYEGLRLEHDHPSYALVSYYSSLETIGGLITGERCDNEHCQSKISSIQKIRAAVQLTNLKQPDKLLIIDGWDRRCDIAHCGQIFGNEIVMDAYYAQIFTLDSYKKRSDFTFGLVKKASRAANRAIISQLRKI